MTGIAIGDFSGDPDEWDRFVRSCPGWSYCHLFGWRAVIERTFGHECVFLEARGADGALAGVLPLVRVKSRLFGHFLVSMPYVNYGGPLGGADAVGALAAHAADLARDSGADLLELRSRRPLELGLAVSRRKITVTLSLPLEGSELLWESLKAKVRSQVRRPGKEGVEARFGHDTATDFYTVFARNMRDLGTPVMPRTFFEGIADVFGEDVWFGCAYLGGRPVAAGAGFRWDDEFEMTWASSLKECNRIAANMLLYWSFMERCVEQGMKTFNFGRCTPGSGTHRFKQQWGGADEQLWWYQWSPKGIVTTPSAENGAYGLTRRVWRVLPVGLTRLLGPAIVSRIP